MSQSPWAEQILNVLLDRFEGSEAHVRGTQSNRRPQVSLEDKILPGYQSGDADPEVRRRFHQTLEEWQGLGLVELKWMRHEEGNILEKVYLEWQGLDQVYAMCGRQPLSQRADALREELNAWASRLALPWMQEWLWDVRRYVEEKRAIPTALIPEDPDKRAALLRSLAGIADKGEEEMPRRVFSSRYLAHSKEFETVVERRLLGLRRRYGKGHESIEDLDDEALLNQLGITLGEGRISLAGPLTFSLNGSPLINVEWFPHGLAMGSSDVALLDIAAMPVRRVLTIENLTSYRWYLDFEKTSDELVLFLNGFPSHGMRRLLQNLWAFSQSMTHPPCFEHWGDIDFGGLQILNQLRRTVTRSFTPWRMDAALLQRFADDRIPIAAHYRQRLTSLLADPEFQDLYPVIETILRTGGTLEQEALAGRL